MAILGALGDLVLALSADTAKFESDLGKADRAAKKFGKEVGRSMDLLAKQIAALAGAGSIGLLIKSQIDAADSAGKMAQKVGISVESFSALKYAMEISEVSVETFEKAMRKLAVGMVDAQSGTGEARVAFRAMGIDVESAAGKLKKGDDILLEIADSFKAMDSGANKAALASKLFGERIGTQLIPFLDLGRAGIEELKKEAERLGVVFSTEAAKAADEFNDNLTRLSNVMKGIAIDIGGPLVKALNEAAKAFQEAQKEGAGFLATLGQIVFRLSMGSDLNIMTRELAGLGGALHDAQNELQEAKHLAAQVNPALADQANRRVDVAAARVKQIEDRMKVLRGIMNDPFAAPEKSDVGAGAKGEAPRLLTDAELKKMNDGAQAFITALGGPLVQAAEEAQNRLEGMVDTWDEFGRRISVPREGFEASVKAADTQLRKALGLDLQETDDLYAHNIAELIAYNDERMRIMIEAATREQDLAVEMGAAAVGADPMSYSMKLEELRSFLVSKSDLEIEQLSINLERQKEIMDQFSDDELEALGGKQALIEGMERAHAGKLLAIERQKHDAERSMEIMTFQLAVGLLSKFAGESKAAALAIIIIEKGLAIAQIKINTLVAAMRARAELGPIAGEAAAARITALGALSIGLVAATGLVEAASLGGAGSGGGPSISLPPSGGIAVTESAPLGLAQRGEPVQTTVIEFNVKDDVLISSKTARKLLETIAESTRQGGRVVVV
jgi:hypothetical protein